MNITKTYISPITGIAIVCSSVIIIFGVGIGGALLGSEYESSCAAKPGEQPICTSRYAYKGLGNLDLAMPSLQTLAAAVGIGFGFYSGFKNGKIPDRLKDFLDGDDAGISGSG